jgi:hypothetical protein
MKYLKKIIFIINFLCLQIISVGFKPDSKKTDINQNSVKNNPNYRKECKVKERCRECTIDELKISTDCQSTGYKTLKFCSYFDDMKLIDEYYFTESCNENKRINPVYIFLIVCIFTGIFSFLVRKTHKNFILNQTLEKLTILRKHN